MSIEKEELMTAAQWEARLKQTTQVSDFDERQAKIERISRDPAPQWSAEPKRDYETTEKHYIICIDEEKANESLPDAKSKYGEPHKFGNYLVSDRLHLPDGWFKAPPRGTPIDTIEGTHPELHSFLKEVKKVDKF